MYQVLQIFMCLTLFIQIWKPIWLPGGHLEFWTSKFVAAISQQLLDGMFSSVVYRLLLNTSCVTSLFCSDLEASMNIRLPSWIMKIKVCYCCFSATTRGILIKLYIMLSKIKKDKSFCPFSSFPVQILTKMQTLHML